jgi:hypothetical protein
MRSEERTGSGFQSTDLITGCKFNTMLPLFLGPALKGPLYLSTTNFLLFALPVKYTPEATRNQDNAQL